MAKEKGDVVYGQSLAGCLDLWKEEIRDIEKFYKKFFSRRINWSIEIFLRAMLNRDTKMKHLEYVFKDITANEVLNTYAEEFGQDGVFKEFRNIDKSIKQQQARPNNDYIISHVGGDRPDMLGKSYGCGINEGIKFMIPVEGFIAALRHRIRTGRMYDVKDMTYFAALDSGGYAIYMQRIMGGQFYIGSDRVCRFSNFGLRRVSF